MINALFIQHRAMPVCRVRAQARINPQAQAVAKLPANFGDGLAGGIMGKRALFLFSRHRKQQEVRHAIGEILFDLLQSRGSVVANCAAQPRYWLVALDPFHHKEWLNQLRAIEFRLSAQIAQVLRSSQTHQTFHRDSSNTRSEPGAVATGSKRNLSSKATVVISSL